MIKNARIGARLGAGFAMVLVFSMLVAGLGIQAAAAAKALEEQAIELRQAVGFFTLQAA